MVTKNDIKNGVNDVEILLKAVSVLGIENKASKELLWESSQILKALLISLEKWSFTYRKNDYKTIEFIIEEKYNDLEEFEDTSVLYRTIGAIEAILNKK